MAIAGEAPSPVEALLLIIGSILGGAYLGAAAGITYAIVRDPLRKIGRAGDYVAGILCVCAYLLASVIPYALLAPLAFIGLFRLARRGGAGTPLLLLALSVVLTGLIFFPQERFRIPAIDPAIIVCAAAVLAEGVRRKS